MRRIEAALVLLLVACAHPAPPAPAAAPSRAERYTLNREGMAAYHAKGWGSCATKLTAAQEWFNAACCLALAGELDGAFAALDRAITVRFSDVDHLREDADLVALRADPRWEGLVERAAEQRERYLASLNRELLEIFEADQADRRLPFDAIDWEVVSPRDQAREARVNEILAAGEARVADDYYHAAMVFQHGGTPAHAQRARDLALQAVALDPDFGAARWLAAAATDRLAMYEGRPQRYGTQFTQRDGVWILWEVEPGVPDEERAEWGVPPLAEAMAHVQRLNAGP